MALGSLLVVGFSLSVAWFALFNLIKPSEGYQSVSTTLATWLLAVMIVWLPVAAFFFLRYRAQAQLAPELNTSRLARFFSAVYLVVTIVATIGFVFAAIFALINSAANVDQSVGNTVVKVTVPALLSALVMAGLALAVTRPGRLLSRGKFMLDLSVLGLAVTLAIFIWSVTANHGYAADSQKVSDIRVLSGQINQYYTSNRSLPTSLNQLGSLSDGVQNRLGDYTYLPHTLGKYELCATFEHESEYYYASTSNNYSDYVADNHPAGYFCFNLSTEYYTQPLDNYYNNDNSSLDLSQPGTSDSSYY